MTGESASVAPTPSVQRNRRVKASAQIYRPPAARQHKLENGGSKLNPTQSNGPSLQSSQGSNIQQQRGTQNHSYHNMNFSQKNQQNSRNQQNSVYSNHPSSSGNHSTKRNTDNYPNAFNNQAISNTSQRHPPQFKNSPRNTRRSRIQDLKEDRSSCPPELHEGKVTQSSESSQNSKNAPFDSYYKGYEQQREEREEQDKQIKSLVETVDKLSSKYFNNTPLPYGNSNRQSEGPRPNRRPRPDQVLYVPKGRRFNTNNGDSEFGRKGISPLAEQYQNYNSSISPAPSITSIVSEFSGRQRYERGEFLSRASSRASIYENDENLKKSNGNSVSNGHNSNPNSPSKGGRLGSNFCSSTSIHCKENVQHPSDGRKRRRNRRGRKKRSQSRDVSCDSVIRNGGTFYNRSNQPSRNSSVERKNNSSSYPCSPSKLQGKTYEADASFCTENFSYINTQSNPTRRNSADKPPTGRPSPTKEAPASPPVEVLEPAPSVVSPEFVSPSYMEAEETAEHSEDSQPDQNASITSSLNDVYKQTPDSFTLDWAAEMEKEDQRIAQRNTRDIKSHDTALEEKSEQKKSEVKYYVPPRSKEQVPTTSYYVPPRKVSPPSHNTKQDYSKYEPFWSTPIPRKSPPSSRNSPSPPRNPSALPSSLSHVLELYDFPTDFKTSDLLTVFQPLQTSTPLEIKWVDDTHALAVFCSTSVADSALALSNSLIKARPLSEASAASKTKALRLDEELLPAKPRPQTSMMLARRLLTGALGVKVTLSRDEKEKEAKAIKDAKDQKRLLAKQRNDAWEGFN